MKYLQNGTEESSESFPSPRLKMTTLIGSQVTQKRPHMVTTEIVSCLCSICLFLLSPDAPPENLPASAETIILKTFDFGTSGIFENLQHKFHLPLNHFGAHQSGRF